MPQPSYNNLANPAQLPQPTPFHRWLVLLFVSLAMFGNYYVYDSLGPVLDLLQNDLGYSNKQTGFLISIYNIGAICALLIGGIIIDRYGTKRALLLFGSICLLGAIVTALSPRYEVMASGRLLLGLGSEPLIVAATTVLAKWFKGKELSFAFGINLSLSRLGSASADWSTSFASPLYTNWQDPLWLATAFAGISVTAAMLYWLQEKRCEGRFSLGIPEQTDKLKFKELFLFGQRYWFIVALCVVFYSTIFPFRTFAIMYFQEAHGLAREAAGMLNSMMMVSAIIATPLFGLLIDKVGKRGLFMTIGCVMMLPLFLAVTYLPAGEPVMVFGSAIPLTLLLIMLLLGCVFSLVPAAMWPSVAYTVDPRRLGTAYATMTLCQQFGWAIVPPVIGFLNDMNQASADNIAGYAPGMWFYTGLAVTGLIFALLLWRHENRGMAQPGTPTQTAAEHQHPG
ncbi:MFS transporter [Arsukibacterium sp.]|uniref:MFS transporter n=1 Tax=Arsukibacterium sp. TaxID=1977258 RepID=UPI002FDB0069